MNALVINGSPKGSRSNTFHLTSAFLKGMQKADPDMKTEVLAISEMNIHPCRGCFACWKSTPGRCCMHDDMAGILEKMLWADQIIWSFPLYYFGIPGPLKTVMDRQLPLNLPFMSRDAKSGGHPSRYDMTGRKYAVISTCGFYTAKGNYDSVTALFDHLYGRGGYAAVFCGQGELFRVREVSERTDAYLASVEQAGFEFVHGGIQEDTKKALSRLLYDRETFEAMADASWNAAQEK